MHAAYLHRPPIPQLQGVVAGLWFIAGAPTTHAVERRMPSAAPQLLINLARDSFRWFEGDRLQSERQAGPMLLSGPADRAFGIATRDQTRLLGVEFCPGAAGLVLGLPMGAAANAHVELRPPVGFRDRLLELAPEEAFMAVEGWLVARMTGRPDPAIREAMGRLVRGETVATVADAVGLSGSGFRRRFQDRVGLTPKRFGRLERFRRAVAALGAGAPPCWAGFALDQGYFDQAHLIRDFRSFAGLTPTAFLPRITRAPQHLVER